MPQSTLHSVWHLEHHAVGPDSGQTHRTGVESPSAPVVSLGHDPVVLNSSPRVETAVVLAVGVKIALDQNL